MSSHSQRSEIPETPQASQRDPARTRTSSLELGGAPSEESSDSEEESTYVVFEIKSTVVLEWSGIGTTVSHPEPLFVCAKRSDANAECWRYANAAKGSDQIIENRQEYQDLRLCIIQDRAPSLDVGTYYLVKEVLARSEVPAEMMEN